MYASDTLDPNIPRDWAPEADSEALVFENDFLREVMAGRVIMDYTVKVYFLSV